MQDFSYEEAVKIDINALKTHPKNSEIYGEDDIEELAEKIKKSGYVKPLYTNSDYVVISGHRRLKACFSLGYKTVPIVIKQFKDKQEELEILLLENMYREKTTEQKVREAEIWEAIEKEKAEKRRLATQNNNTAKAVKENFPTQVESGQTRDIVAKKVGIGSGKTLEVAKKVVTKIDEYKVKGEIEKAENLSKVLNKSVSGAKKIIDENLPPNVTSLSKVREIKEDEKPIEEPEDFKEFCDYVDTAGEISKKYRNFFHECYFIKSDDKTLNQWKVLLTNEIDIEEYIRTIESTIPKLLKIQKFLKEVQGDGKKTI
ncbi:MAG: ParB N-terminal domain-containing protein [Clostridium sp.]|uniref:ParB/RepB/Spo0J family partition protein n=1 Tax=Clostridium sp. TaxID=1506 RepID=UPI0039E7D34D